MAFKLVNKNPDGTYYYIADDESDVQNLPTENIPTGSSCLVLGDGSGSVAYITNTTGEWIRI